MGNVAAESQWHAGQELVHRRLAAIKNNIADRSKPVEIEMDGGTLSIEWKDDNHIYMTGPATFAFEGEVELPEG